MVSLNTASVGFNLTTRLGVLDAVRYAYFASNHFPDRPPTVAEKRERGKKQKRREGPCGGGERGSSWSASPAAEGERRRRLASSPSAAAAARAHRALLRRPSFTSLQALVGAAPSRPALRFPVPSSSGAPGGRRRRDLGDDSTGNARIRHLLRSLPPPVLPIFFPHAQRPSPPESTHSLDSCSSLSPPSASPHFPSSGDPLPTALEP
jgi:hypothetical protein